MVNNGPTGRKRGDDSSPVTARKASGSEIITDFNSSRDLQKHIMDLVTAGGYDPQSVFAVKLALEEAVINAIKHGNKNDPKKKVLLEYSVTPERCEIIIEDEGAGFQRCDVPDPTLDENIHKCSGRGILLIEAYMNVVEYSKGGRRVRMVKTNEQPATARK